MTSRAHATSTVRTDQLLSRDGTGEPSVTPRDLSDYLDAARIRLGIQVKEIAFWWGCDHGYVSRVLGGKEKLTDERFAQLRQNEESRRLYVATLEEACADEHVLTGRKAALLRTIEGLYALASDDRLGVPVRMAKVSLPEHA
jgi:hypothetical protein